MIGAGKPNNSLYVLMRMVLRNISLKLLSENRY